MTRTNALLLALVLFFATPAAAQFNQDIMRRILEEYSLQMFGENAEGYMSPLVIVSNIGANHGFFTTARTESEDRLHFAFSVQTVGTWVRDDQRTYTGRVPYAVRPTDSPELGSFKYFLTLAARNGDLDTLLTTSTVFGGQGSWFRIPKAYLRAFGIPEDQIALVPDSLQLTSGTNQKTVIAAVPQLFIGTWKHTDMLLRYIPPITFDSRIGKFSFFGVAVRHGFTHWIENAPIDAAVQVSYQHTTLDNTVGVTKARLEAATDMFSVNLHAGRRFDWLEPFIGVSFEVLRSKGSYTFTLPATVVAQIGYDIAPQTARVSLSDEAVKLTLGVSGHFGPLSVFASTGISKHVIVGGGLSWAFDPPW